MPRTNAPCAASVAHALNHDTLRLLTFRAKKTSAWPAARLSQSSRRRHMVSTRCSMLRTLFSSRAHRIVSYRHHVNALRRLVTSALRRIDAHRRRRYPSRFASRDHTRTARAVVTLARVHALRSDLQMFTPWCVRASVADFVVANHAATVVFTRRFSSACLARVKTRWKPMKELNAWRSLFRSSRAFIHAIL